MKPIIGVTEFIQNHKAVLDAVEDGQDLLIMRRGRPVALLLPFEADGSFLSAEAKKQIWDIVEGMMTERGREMAGKGEESHISEESTAN